MVGESGGILAQWLKPSCHHLGLSLVAVLEVVGSIPAGDLPFGFWQKTDPELKQWSNFRAAVRGEVGVHQQKKEWIWGPCVT